MKNQTWTKRKGRMILAATGHRPNKLGGYTEQTQNKLFKLARCYLTRQQQKDTNLEVISGMALGWDTAWALAALDLQIPLIAALPFRGQDAKWPWYHQAIHSLILRSATAVHVVTDGGFSAWKMQARNQWMVDNCTRIVALWDGSDGGTDNCLSYARGRVEIKNLWKKYNTNSKLW